MVAQDERAVGGNPVQYLLAGPDRFLVVIVEEDRPFRVLETRVVAMGDVGHMDKLIVS